MALAVLGVCQSANVKDGLTQEWGRECFLREVHYGDGETETEVEGAGVLWYVNVKVSVLQFFFPTAVWYSMCLFLVPLFWGRDTRDDA